ncbi:putative disease resistance protein At3g14460 [Vigna unguiculata]|uniref:putative disease resistance protein At3g14460 n=1 Tax=Vigna unguiculata TaxID=3917 RepID=UPI001016B7A2|nr:putative disease resistance protein At3g14460 [Vigna unguiculata]
MTAEMVTGALVSAFLERTIDTLASRFMDIFRARKHKKKQLSDLKMKLFTIDVVAYDAEQKQFTDPRVRDWLLRAKDVVFDAEDLLDEIDYELLTNQVVEAESQSATKKVWNSLKSSFVSFFENEIESKMDQVIEDLEDLATQSDFLGLKKASGAGIGSGSGSKLTYTSLPNETVIYGRDDDKEFVFNWLTSDTDNKLSILSIVGMGGLGKTSLAQHVFNDPRLEAKFDIKAWISVPQEFDVLNVSRAILDTITGSTEHSMQQEVIQRKLKEKIMGKKFLLILDDVWNEKRSKWEDVQKPLTFGGQGSRILVTTRSEKVVATMRSEKHLLQVLKEDYCWDLFAKHAFQSYNPQTDPDFVEIGKNIVKKCNALPLALKTTGSLLHNKSSLWEWESIMKSEIWDFSENESDILPALRLSCLHLPSHLKKCFAFCAMFPKGYRFDKDLLIQLWMAEMFLESPLKEKSPEEVGEQYFNDLVSWSFFQLSGDDEENYFIMHDLLNDLAKYVSEDICIRLGFDEPKGISNITRHCSFSTAKFFFDGFGSSINTQKLRTFIQTDWRTNFPFPLRSWHCTTSIDDLFSKFKSIRVLYLSHCTNLREVPKSVGNLKHFRSLDLSHTDIEKLPDSMSLLYKLQILKLNKCEKLKELPSYLHELDNLRCLELVNTGVKNVPAHLGKMKNVQVLMSPFYVEKSKEFSIQQLGDLNLHGSLTIDELQNIENPSYALEANLKSKAHLVELVLNWNFIENSSVDSAKAGDVIENLRPSKYLKKLAIKNYVGNQLPNWLLNNSLLNMVSLVLRRCKSCQRFPPLGLLPFLKNLEISGFEEIVNIDADFHGNNSSSFKSLERLEFSSMSQWEKWDCQDVTGAFPRLHYFSISSCPKLKGHLPEFVALKTLRVIRCEHVEALIVFAIELRLQDCGKLQLELSTTNKLRMGGHTMEASMVKTVGHIIFNTSLEYLSIYSPLKSISDDCVSLRTFPLHFFPKLKNLYLGGFCNLQRISQHEPHNHLKDLKIKNCPKFESFPENMHRMSLWELWIEECPKLESFPNGGLPSNLSFMDLKDCSKLIGSLRGAFRDNPSLRCLWIEKVDAKSFPDEGLLPCSLVSLTILDFPNLEKLDHKGLYQLSSLEKLGLWNCPNLQHLPEEGLPISISRLQIRNCPLLKERCQEEGGEDWQKIAHIQDLEIQE